MPFSSQWLRIMDGLSPAMPSICNGDIASTRIFSTISGSFVAGDELPAGWPVFIATAGCISETPCSHLKIPGPCPWHSGHGWTTFGIKGMKLPAFAVGLLLNLCGGYGNSRPWVSVTHRSQIILSWSSSASLQTYRLRKPENACILRGAIAISFDAMVQERDLIPFHAARLPAGHYLVFAPHADDETIGLGGTLVLAARKGISATVVVLTDGAQGGEVQKRKEEAGAACKVLGARNLYFWDFPDRHLHCHPDAVEKIAGMISSIAPGTVFFPSPLEFHPDHRATARFVWQALQKVRYPGQVWHYEISRQAEANRLIDISSVSENKLQALRCYQGQLQQNNYEASVLGLNALRTYTLPSTVTYAEAFYQYENLFREGGCADLSALTLRLLLPYFDTMDQALSGQPAGHGRRKRSLRTWFGRAVQKILRQK
ncbi:MAG TPA: hypothetical protein ENF70_00365 [Deltaproteobacteria bacterium]|nr:hypothetical protein [Deltaproteobacteria bacterium]